jgi:hypothetical protein
MRDGLTDAGLAQAEAAANALLDEAKAGRRGVAYVCCPRCGADVDLADFNESGDAGHGDGAPHAGCRPDAGKLRLHEPEDCWCGSRHVMRLASEIGWDTSELGDRLIMTVEEGGQRAVSTDSAVVRPDLLDDLVYAEFTRDISASLDRLRLAAIPVSAIVLSDALWPDHCFMHVMGHPLIRIAADRGMRWGVVACGEEGGQQ